MQVCTCAVFKFGYDIANHLRWKSFTVVKLNFNSLDNIHGWMVVSLYGQSLLHKLFHWKGFTVTNRSSKTSKLFHLNSNNLQHTVLLCYVIFYVCNLTDGQYMASRISKGIQRETQQLKRLLTNYNQLVPKHLSWKDATDLSSSIWNPIDSNDTSLPPRSIRLAAIDAYVKKLRATEEKELIKAEMHNVISFYFNQYNEINGLLDSVPSNSDFSRGCLVLLHEKLSECKKRLFNNYSAFKEYTQLPQIPEELIPVRYECTLYI